MVLETIATNRRRKFQLESSYMLLQNLKTQLLTAVRDQQAKRGIHKTDHLQTARCCAILKMDLCLS